MVQRSTRGAERCTVPRRRSAMSISSLEWCRLTPLPWSSPRGLRERAPARCAWRRAHHKRGVPRPPSQHRGNRRRCGHASDANHTWFLSQRSVTARAAHSAEDWRRHALFMARPSKEPSRTERARVALACVWMQLLKLRKTATSQGCKYVLRGGKKHSTTCGKAAFMAARVASLACMLAM